MKKFDFTPVIQPWKLFGGHLKASYLFFLIPLSFAYTLAISVLIFVKTIIGVLFCYLSDEKAEPAIYRAAVVIAFSPLLLARNVIFGALDVALFFLGLFYDINIKFVSFGKNKTVYTRFH